MLRTICRITEWLSVPVFIAAAAFFIYGKMQTEEIEVAGQQQDFMIEATDLAASMLDIPAESATISNSSYEDSRANAFLQSLNAARNEMGIAPLELDYFLCREAFGEADLISCERSLPSTRILNDITDIAGEVYGATVLRGNLSTTAVMEAISRSDNDTAQLLNQNYTKIGFASDKYGLLWVLLFSD